MSATTVPTLDHPARSLEDRIEAWSHWFLQPKVLIRVVLYLTTLIYLRTVLFDYVYDDTVLITLNPWMESWKQVPQLLTHSFWGFLDIPRSIDFYRPLVSLVLATILHLLGPAPGWFHLAAAGLHILATYLVYRLACETVGNEKFAAIAAGFFGLHPTKVETAAWISGISDSLSAVLFLASMIWYFKARETREHRTKYLLLSTIFLLLALFSKEAAIFAPVLIGIYEFSAANSRFRDRCLASLRAAWPFVAISGAALLARKTLIRNDVSQGLRDIPLLSTILTAPRSILWYLGKQVWPTELSVQYPIMLVRTFSVSQFLIPLVVVLGLVIALSWAIRRNPTGIFFASWFALMLAPVILYLISLQEHDRYSYLPSVAISMGIAYLLGFTETLGGVRIQAAILLVLFALLAGLTANYESYWDNDTKLFTRAVEIAPDNVNAAEYLATSYVTLGQREKGEAVGKRLIASANAADGWYILGTILLYENKFEEARDALQTALKLWGRHPLTASLALASADSSLGRNEEAAEIYREQLRRWPNKAFLHGYLATALRAAGKLEEAKRESEIQKKLQ